LWMAALILSSAHILLSLAFYLTYSTIDAPNFSISILFSIGAYQSFIIAKIMNLPVYLSIPLSVTTGFLVNSIIYLLLIKPIVKRNTNKVLLVLATIGLSIALTSMIQATAIRIRDVYGIYAYVFLLKNHDFRLFGIPGVFIVSSIIVFLVSLVWRHVLQYTIYGACFRAILENKELALIQGVNIERSWLIVWGVSGSLACLSGAFIPFWYSFSAGNGTMIINAVIAASFLGGLKNPRGFFIGGLISGVLEIMITFYGVEVLGMWFGDYRPLIPIVIIAFVFCFRPQGILGVRNEG
jgi:branched-chain amino acid transport system permease protein